MRTLEHTAVLMLGQPHAEEESLQDTARAGDVDDGGVHALQNLLLEDSELGAVAEAFTAAQADTMPDSATEEDPRDAVKAAAEEEPATATLCDDITRNDTLPTAPAEAVRESEEHCVDVLKATVEMSFLSAVNPPSPPAQGMPSTSTAACVQCKPTSNGSVLQTQHNATDYAHT